MFKKTPQCTYLNFKSTLLLKNANHRLSLQQVIIFAGGGSYLDVGGY